MPSKTRDKLIDVARQLFVHKGVERTTMNDIAEASSKGRRTIYTYFKNKKEIYNAVIETESERMMGELRTLASEPLPVRQRLANVLLRRLELANETNTSSNSFKFLFKPDQRRMERVRQLVRDKERGLLLELIGEGVGEGVFDPRRCAMLEKFIVRCIQGMDYEPAGEDDLPSIAEARRAMVDFIISDITIEKAINNHNR